MLQELDYRENYLVNRALVIKYGMNGAFFLGMLIQWSRTNYRKRSNIHDGRIWVYNTLKAWQEHIPFWSQDQLRTVISNLVKSDAIVKGHYNVNRFDRTVWYALSEELTREFVTTDDLTARVEEKTDILEVSYSEWEDYHTSFGKIPKSEMGKVPTDNIGNNIHYQNTLPSNLYSPAKDFAVQKEREEEYSSSSCSCDETTETTEQNPEKVTNDRRRRTSEKSKCLFANSRYFDKDKFFAEFTAQDQQAIDLNYYYNSVADWSAANGKMKKDWIATARNFIRKDVEIGKLHKKKNEYGLTQDDTGEIEFMMREWKQRNQ